MRKFRRTSETSFSPTLHLFKRKIVRSCRLISTNIARGGEEGVGVRHHRLLFLFWCHSQSRAAMTDRLKQGNVDLLSFQCRLSVSVLCHLISLSLLRGRVQSRPICPRREEREMEGGAQKFHKTTKKVQFGAQNPQVVVSAFTGYTQSS